MRALGRNRVSFNRVGELVGGNGYEGSEVTVPPGPELTETLAIVSGSGASTTVMKS